ncbi:MAG: NUDIX domain-containing protein [Chloroflexi bacterium]|nr:MAG: NUDIX hydrolase [Chloroflexi bacterium OLB13]MBW7877774.1 NUDIX domain-containing protein [Anaerolineae bacterium]MCC6565431.1 NUDIX domain-containing protein [Chloroflexota bacterium]OQY80603.1 MAG: hypothetical protein B6D42_12825 [Anaerolineae bacterium UTCFX5]MCO6442447.1 NUDIX domain-containing protein [Anaerolineae bacterium]
MPPHIRVSASAVIVRRGHILLVKFDDRTGPHYNLPGGGADPGETVEEACIREVYEEAGARITIGRLLMVREYEPVRCRSAFGKRHKLNLVFEGLLLPGSEPRMPHKPDAHQIGVEWVALNALPHLNLVSPSLPGQIARSLRGASKPYYVREEC